MVVMNQAKHAIAAAQARQLLRFPTNQRDHLLHHLTLYRNQPARTRSTRTSGANGRADELESRAEAAHRLYRLLERLSRSGAGGLRLQIGERPQFNVGDSFREAGLRPLNAEELHDLVQLLIPEASRDELEKRGETHFSFDFGPTARFAVVVRTRGSGLLMVIRPS